MEAETVREIRMAVERAISMMQEKGDNVCLVKNTDDKTDEVLSFVFVVGDTDEKAWTKLMLEAIENCAFGQKEHVGANFRIRSENRKEG